ncbi:MAG: hypothetical protein K6G40_06265 [Eubacterium sp.]|nr:hypothetical protein [Eubacterium sp.]
MKAIRIIYIIIFALLLTLPGIYILASDDKEFSENENRYLAGAPEITAERFLKNKLQKDMTDYISDQFPARNTFMETSTEIKKVAGYKDINGAYLGSDGYYFEKISDTDIEDKKLKANMATINKFALGNGLDTRVMLVPSSGSVLTENMPDGAKCYDYEAHLPADTDFKNISILNAYEVLSQEAKASQVYYKTDHHWTSYGAYLGSSLLKESAGLEIKSYDYYEPDVVSKEFYGTLYSKVLDKEAEPDTMELPKNLPSVSVEVAGGKDKLNGIYDEAKLEVKDKYAVFFGGNFGTVKINTGANTGRNLLVIKDSFANSFVPYLFEDYDNIVMVDLRFYSGGVSDIVKECDINEMLVLYEMSNFAKDMNFYKIK